MSKAEQLSFSSDPDMPPPELPFEEVAAAAHRIAQADTGPARRPEYDDHTSDAARYDQGHRPRLRSQPQSNKVYKTANQRRLEALAPIKAQLLAKINQSPTKPGM